MAWRVTLFNQSIMASVEGTSRKNIFDAFRDAYEKAGADFVECGGYKAWKHLFESAAKQILRRTSTASVYVPTGYMGVEVRRI